MSTHRCPPSQASDGVGPASLDRDNANAPYLRQFVPDAGSQLPQAFCEAGLQWTWSSSNGARRRIDYVGLPSKALVSTTFAGRVEDLILGSDDFRDHRPVLWQGSLRVGTPPATACALRPVIADRTSLADVGAVSAVSSAWIAAPLPHRQFPTSVAADLHIRFARLLAARHAPRVSRPKRKHWLSDDAYSLADTVAAWRNAWNKHQQHQRSLFGRFLLRLWRLAAVAPSGPAAPFRPGLSWLVWPDTCLSVAVALLQSWCARARGPARRKVRSSYVDWLERQATQAVAAYESGRSVDVLDMVRLFYRRPAAPPLIRDVAGQVVADPGAIAKVWRLNFASEFGSHVSAVDPSRLFLSGGSPSSTACRSDIDWDGIAPPLVLRMPLRKAVGCDVGLC